MLLNEAIEVLEKFTNTIKDLRPSAIVQSDNVLPCTKGKIKFAHFVAVEELINNNKMTRETGLQLVNSYGIIDSFFVENSELENKKYQEYILGLKNGIITNYVPPNPFGEVMEVLEFQNFIEEIYFKLNKQYIFGKGYIPGSMYYHVLVNEKKDSFDLKARKDMINTPLTRNLDFPGKKNEEESVFI